MAQKIDDFYYDVRLNTSQYQKSVAAIKTQSVGVFTGLGKTLQGVGSSIGNFFNATLGPIAIAIGAFKAIQETLSAFEGQEKATLKLETAMKNLGTYSEKAMQDYQAFAGEMQKATGYADDQVLELIAVGKTMGISDDKMKDMVKTAIDLNKVYGVDTQSALSGLVKMYNGNAAAIGKLVPELKDMDKAGASADEMFKKLSTSVGGQAEKLKGIGGGLTDLSNAVGDFMEVVGGALAPLINGLASGLAGLINNLSGLFNGIGQAFKNMDAQNQLKSLNNELANAKTVETYAAAVDKVKQALAGMSTETIKAQINLLEIQLKGKEMGRGMVQMDIDKIKNAEALLQTRKNDLIALKAQAKSEEDFIALAYKMYGFVKDEQGKYWVNQGNYAKSEIKNISAYGAALKLLYAGQAFGTDLKAPDMKPEEKAMREQLKAMKELLAEREKVVKENSSFGKTTDDDKKESEALKAKRQALALEKENEAGLRQSLQAEKDSTANLAIMEELRKSIQTSLKSQKTLQTDISTLTEKEAEQDKYKLERAKIVTDNAKIDLDIEEQKKGIIQDQIDAKQRIIDFERTIREGLEIQLEAEEKGKNRTKEKAALKKQIAGSLQIENKALKEQKELAEGATEKAKLSLKILKNEVDIKNLMRKQVKDELADMESIRANKIKEYEINKANKGISEKLALEIRTSYEKEEQLLKKKYENEKDVTKQREIQTEYLRIMGEKAAFLNGMSKEKKETEQEITYLTKQQEEALTHVQSIISGVSALLNKIGTEDAQRLAQLTEEMTAFVTSAIRALASNGADVGAVIQTAIAGLSLLGTAIGGIADSIHDSNLANDEMAIAQKEQIENANKIYQEAQAYLKTLDLINEALDYLKTIAGDALDKNELEQIIAESESKLQTTTETLKNNLEATKKLLSDNKSFRVQIDDNWFNPETGALLAEFTDEYRAAMTEINAANQDLKNSSTDLSKFMEGTAFDWLGNASENDENYKKAKEIVEDLYQSGQITKTMYDNFTTGFIRKEDFQDIVDFLDATTGANDVLLESANALISNSKAYYETSKAIEEYRTQLNGLPTQERLDFENQMQEVLDSNIALLKAKQALEKEGSEAYLEYENQIVEALKAKAESIKAEADVTTDTVEKNKLLTEYYQTQLEIQEAQAKTIDDMLSTYNKLVDTGQIDLENWGSIRDITQSLTSAGLGYSDVLASLQEIGVKRSGFNASGAKSIAIGSVNIREAGTPSATMASMQNVFNSTLRGI